MNEESFPAAVTSAGKFEFYITLFNDNQHLGEQI